MECKFLQHHVLHPGENELIETLWNVNRIYYFTENNVFGELIETLWNVNNSGGTRDYIDRTN